MDIIYIRDLKVETIIGVFGWDREVKQVVSLDLDMGADIAAAAKTEDIDQTLSYKTVTKRLIAFIESSKFLLVETMAEEIAQLVLSEFDVPWLRLRLSKPGAVRGTGDAGVIIERTQTDLVGQE